MYMHIYICIYIYMCVRVCETQNYKFETQNEECETQNKYFETLWGGGGVGWLGLNPWN